MLLSDRVPRALDREHAFEVRAVDPAGNMDQTPDSRTWTVIESTPPETTIDSGPEGMVAPTSVAFTFSASEPGCELRMPPRRGRVRPCTSPVELPAWRRRACLPGPGRRCGRQCRREPAGAALDGRWRRARVMIDAPPSGVVASAAATLTFASEAGASFECRLDAADFVPCTSPLELHRLAGRGSRRRHPRHR